MPTTAGRVRARVPVWLSWRKVNGRARAGLRRRKGLGLSLLRYHEVGERFSEYCRVEGKVKERGRQAPLDNCGAPYSAPWLPCTGGNLSPETLACR